MRSNVKNDEVSGSDYDSNGSPLDNDSERNSDVDFTAGENKVDEDLLN